MNLIFPDIYIYIYIKPRSCFVRVRTIFLRERKKFVPLSFPTPISGIPEELGRARRFWVGLFDDDGGVIISLETDYSRNYSSFSYLESNSVADLKVRPSLVESVIIALRLPSSIWKKERGGSLVGRNEREPR